MWNVWPGTHVEFCTRVYMSAYVRLKSIDFGVLTHLFPTILRRCIGLHEDDALSCIAFSTACLAFFLGWDRKASDGRMAPNSTMVWRLHRACHDPWSVPFSLELLCCRRGQELWQEIGSLTKIMRRDVVTDDVHLLLELHWFLFYVMYSWRPRGPVIWSKNIFLHR